MKGEAGMGAEEDEGFGRHTCCASVRCDVTHGE